MYRCLEINFTIVFWCTAAGIEPIVKLTINFTVDFEHSAAGFEQIVTLIEYTKNNKYIIFYIFNQLYDLLYSCSAMLKIDRKVDCQLYGWLNSCSGTPKNDRKVDFSTAVNQLLFVSLNIIFMIC